MPSLAFTFSFSSAWLRRIDSFQPATRVPAFTKTACSSEKRIAKSVYSMTPGHHTSIPHTTR
ncbi:MAG: hypothetical protein U5K31_06960 [Balneolaceae bacterium]|nr:hypothetical protein [Balneolaceae bacterium]